MNSDRRDFLKRAAWTVGLAASGSLTDIFADTAPALAAQPPESSDQAAHAGVPQRDLGRTGVKVSMVGLGGAHLGSIRDRQEAIRLARSAIDRGITFFDNSWDYYNGRSEEYMGQALRDGYRDKVFLMTKFDGRTRKAAAQQIDQSLQRLSTDHVDLLQIHEVIRMNDPERCFAADGAIEALDAARKAGKTRFVGFTGHKDPSMHLHMLEVAKAHDYRFDAVQMPLNVMDAHYHSFEKQVLPVLVNQQIGVLGMKSMGGNFILRSNTATAVECLRYAMNLPTSVVITGIENARDLDQAIAAAQSFQPMTQQQVAALVSKTAKAAADGQYEKFKTANMFDSTVHHPEWMG